MFDYEKYKGGYKILGFKDEYYTEDYFELVLPEDTVAIDDGVFAEMNITSVCFPDSLEEICVDAFCDCESLEYISFSSVSRLKSIADGAFSGTSIKHLSLPKGIEKIDDDAFLGCKRLESVSFNGCKSLRDIGSEAFSGCVSLKNISLPEGLVTLGYEAFAGCSSLSYVGIPSTLKEMDFDVFSGCGMLSQISIDMSAIPEDWDEDWLSDCTAKVNLFGMGSTNGAGSSKSLSNNNGCRGGQVYTPMSKLKIQPYPYGEGKYTVLGPVEWGIEELNLHPDIVDIANEAFKDQLHLKSFKANCDYVIIGDRAFAGCCALKEISFKRVCLCDDSFAESGVKHALIANTNNRGAYRGSSVESFSVPEGETLTYIGRAALAGTRLKELRVPDTVTDIGADAFRGSYSLEKVDLNNVRYVGEGAFMDCGRLKEIKFPERECSIWYEAFAGCYSLERVELGANMSISKGMFDRCTSLKEVIIKNPKETAADANCFRGCPIERVVFKNTRFSDFLPHLEWFLSGFSGRQGTPIELVFKDKTVKEKYRKSRCTWMN